MEDSGGALSNLSSISAALEELEGKPLSNLASLFGKVPQGEVPQKPHLKSSAIFVVLGQAPRKTRTRSWCAKMLRVSFSHNETRYAHTYFSTEQVSDVMFTALFCNLYLFFIIYIYLCNLYNVFFYYSASVAVFNYSASVAYLRFSLKLFIC